MGVTAYTHRKVRASIVFLSYLLHGSIVGFFAIRHKRIRGGGAFPEGNSATLTAAGRQGRMGGREQGEVREREGGREKGSERWREGARGGREEAMMIGRDRMSVEEGRVEGGRVAEGNERGRDGPRHGRREGKKGGRKRAEEGLSEKGMEQLRE